MATPATLIDATWYPDSSASHLSTFDQRNLINSLEFDGSKQVEIGKAQVWILSILGILFFTLKCQTHPIILTISCMTLVSLKIWLVYQSLLEIMVYF